MGTNSRLLVHRKPGAMVGREVGYEIPFTRFFYQYQAPRDLREIEGEIETIENELLTLLKKL